MSGLPDFGPDAVFDHVGMAVQSIRAVAGDDTAVVNDATQRVSVAFVDVAGLRVELIEPHGDRSPVDASLRKGQVLVHLCFRVPSLEIAIEHGRRSGLHQLARPVPAPAFDGRRIAWLFNKSVGLIELVEAAPQPTAAGN